MIHLRRGSHAAHLISVMSVVGEFPTSGLHLIGNERGMKYTVRCLAEPQLFHNPGTKEELTCRLFGISGHGADKTIRFYHTGLPILDWIEPGARDYYLQSFYNHRFAGDASHKDRNHRMAEAVAMFSRIGVEYRPYRLPPLQSQFILHSIPDTPSFYNAKELKRVDDGELKKVSYSRILGLLFGGGNRYAVYNARNAAMKWAGQSEFRARSIVSEICRFNAGGRAVESAVLMGRSYDVALRILGERDKKQRDDYRFDAVYKQVYFIPQTVDGMRQLRILLQPDWRESILSLLFDSSTRSYDRGNFEYDAYNDDSYILTNFDGDIARLLRFREACSDSPGKMQALCFPHQGRFLREFLPDSVRIRTVTLNDMESALGLPKLKGDP